MIRNPVISAILFFTAIIFLGSCSKKYGNDGNIPQPTKPVVPHITSFAPASGAKGISVVITGTGFSSGVAVMVNGIPATVTAATATSITINVPAGAGSGKISVLSGTVIISSADDFLYVYTVGSLAGDGTFGFKDGTGAEAHFLNPFGLATDAAGNIYVADTDNQRIRKITPGGVVSTIAGRDSAGFVNGTGAAAKFNNPHALAVDAAGNIFVTDAGNHVIRKVTQAGVVSTFAGDGTPGLVNGTGTAAKFNMPQGIAIDATGNLFVTDAGNHCIRKITPAGIVSTLTDATFLFANGIAADAHGNLFVVDTGNGHIMKISSTGVMSIFAGSTFGFMDGPGAAAKFSNPEGIAIDASGNLFVSDVVNNAIRKITPTGIVSTIAGSGPHDFKDGLGPDALFYFPIGIAVDAAGNIYIGDTVNQRIRKLQ